MGHDAILLHPAHLGICTAIMLLPTPADAITTSVASTHTAVHALQPNTCKDKADPRRLSQTPSGLAENSEILYKLYTSG
jgi:hypothetical protein